MENTVHVAITIPFSETIFQKLRAISPRLHIEYYTPPLSDKDWETVEVLYTYNVLPKLTQQAPNLRWIQLNSAGANHLFEIDGYDDTDIIATTVKGIHAIPAAEYTLGMILAWEHKFISFFQQQREKKWGKLEHHNFYAPRTLRELTVGIVGYGNIGQAFARLANSMDMKILVTKRHLHNLTHTSNNSQQNTNDPICEIPERIYPPEAIADMASICDFLVLICPLTHKTKHMINDQVFEKMKPTSVLINIARGGIVHEQALIEALQQDKIAGAILDVFEKEPLPNSSPLWAMDNVIISPHIAGNSHYYSERATDIFAENLKRYLRGEELTKQVDRNLGY